MKKFMITMIAVAISTISANAQMVFPDKASKKNYKALQHSTMIAEASRAGKANKALRHMDKMQNKADKMNKKAGKFK